MLASYIGQLQTCYLHKINFLKLVQAGELISISMYSGASNETKGLVSSSCTPEFPEAPAQSRKKEHKTIDCNVTICDTTSGFPLP